VASCAIIEDLDGVWSLTRFGGVRVIAVLVAVLTEGLGDGGAVASVSGVFVMFTSVLDPLAFWEGCVLPLVSKLREWVFDSDPPRTCTRAGVMMKVRMLTWTRTWTWAWAWVWS
jgi:hypothetical protein